MSGVYIRSQNKEELYRFDSSFACLGYKEGEGGKKIKGEIHLFPRHIICIHGSGCEKEIAEYESKERCIEVLDELQGVCAQYLYASGSPGLMLGSKATPPFAMEIPRVYQMPEH